MSENNRVSNKIAITYAHAQQRSIAETLSAHLKLPIITQDFTSFSVLLHITENHIELMLTEKKSPGAVYVDFVHGAVGYRRQQQGGKNQLIARAVGIKSKEKLSVLDLTAGLGRDGLVLATLGCDVTLCERSPIIHALLEDGIRRAQLETWFEKVQLRLMHNDALQYLSQLSHDQYPDVIYIDPMFPDKNKSALVKKEMRVLREVVGDDVDAEKLLPAAMLIAKKRVVVKRSKLAPTISDQKPDVVYKGKSSRFDVYLNTHTLACVTKRSL